MAFLHPSNKPYNQLVRKREEVELEIPATGESSQPDALVKHLNPSILQLKLPKNQTNKRLLDSHSFTNERPSKV